MRIGHHRGSARSIPSFESAKILIRELLRSSFADLANIGGRWGGAISAAYFLKEFAEETPWVHLDIAGTAWNDDAQPWLAKGPTGVGLSTMVHLVTSM